MSTYAVRGDSKRRLPQWLYNLDTLTKSNRLLWISLLIGSALSLFVSYQIATTSILLGSREARRVYPYIQPFGARSLVVFLVVSLVAGSLVALHGALWQRGEWLPVLV